MYGKTREKRKENFNELRLVDSLLRMPFFSDKKLVIIEDVNLGTRKIEDVLDRTKEINVLVYVLRNKEYEFNGNRGFYSEPFKLITVKAAQDQKFRKPADKLLSNSAPTPNAEGFVPIPDSIEEEIPF
mgnify:CR=1 FL=1